MELVKRSNAYQKPMPNYHWISRGAINCKSNALPSLDLHCIVQCLALHRAVPCLALSCHHALHCLALTGDPNSTWVQRWHRNLHNRFWASLPNPVLENHHTWRPKHSITSKSGPGDLQNPLKSIPGNTNAPSHWNLPLETSKILQNKLRCSFTSKML